MALQDANQGKHKLYGTEVSLYTGKARAYLRFKGIPFDEVLSTRDMYKRVIVPRTGVRFIPIVITDDDVAIQDTTDIIDAFEVRKPEPAIYPDTPLQRLLALLLEVYGDEWLVIPAMHYRWNLPDNRAFAIGEFGRTSFPEASTEEQRQIGEKLSGPFAGALPFLGITPATEQAVEQSYLGFLSELDAHLAEHPFVFGTRPSIGDFGLFGPLYAHLYRDPASGELMRRVAPKVADWVLRMQTPDGQPGAFLPSDQVPATVLPLVRRMFREQVPVLLDTVDRVAEWADGNKERELPRSIGWHSFTLEGATEKKAINPYHQWMWQRPCDFYNGLPTDARAVVDAWLGAIPGAKDALARPIPTRLVRENNRVALAR